MNALTVNRPSGLSSAFAGRALPDMNKAAQENLAPSFSVVGYKGRNWRLKARGDEELLKDERGVPLATLNVVIVGISPHISKQYYEKRYAEGDDASPDCWSLDGVAPVETAPKKQCATCAACPQNAYGSKITEAGKKAKACQDSRRLAVVPSGDIENETYGGPMLLRLPPMSLGQLARYGNELTRFSAQPFMVETQLGFDYDVAYPLITFKANGWLDDDQASQVARMLDNPLINRILEADVDVGAGDGVSAEQPSALSGGAPAGVFSGAAEVEAELEAKASRSAAPAAPAAPATPAPAASRRAAPRPASAPAPAPAPAPVAAALVQHVADPAEEPADADDAEAAAAEAAAIAALEAARARRAAAKKAAPATAPVPAPAVAAPQPAATAPQPAPEDLSQAIEALLAD